MKRALVTGGSGFLGAAICRRLSEAGHHVIVHGHRNVAAADSIVGALKSGGGSAEAIVFDIRNQSDCADCLSRLLEGGPIQILVNNAGVHDDAPMAGMTPEQWAEVINVSLYGFFNVTQPLLLPMIRTRWGRIVNLSSVSAEVGTIGQANYAAAKAGLVGATKSLAREVASRGVTVNAVAPGIISGGMAAGLLDPKYLKEAVPMKRAGTAEEVASLVAFLTTEEASYITGQSIGINGGMA